MSPPRPRDIPSGNTPGTVYGITRAAVRPPADSLRALSHLTDRDMRLAVWLHQHGVLTTAQITAALFDHPTTASHRLRKLLALGLVDRFHRPLPGGGASAWHWVIGPLGAQLSAAADGTAPPSASALYQRHVSLAASPQLEHRLGTNGFFIDLHAHARRHPGTRLLRWWSEWDTLRRYGGRIRPDGHGLWEHTGSVTGFFLEYDTGTEALPRLVRKLEAYRQLRADGGPAYPVLFSLHSRRREQNLHTLLAELGPRVLCATAVREPGSTPADEIWLRPDIDGRRGLHQLPCDHGDPDSMFTPNLHDPKLDLLV